MENHPDEKELLELCKTKIAGKFSYLGYGKWVNNDFIRLSDEILETTKSYLSPTSLKRIFGKISSEAFPKKTTLDILTQYLDYKDWNDFALKHKSLLEKKDAELTIQVDPVQEKSASKTFSFKFWLAVIVCLCLSGISYWYFSKASKVPTFQFVQSKSFSNAPFTASFKIDFQEKKEKNAVLDFSDPFETDLKFTNYSLSEQSQTVAHTYMIPGVYHPTIRIQDQIVDSLDVPVYSNGWEWVVVNYNEKDRAFHTIKDQAYFRKEGVFCIPASEVIKYKVDTVTSYCMRYMNYQDFKTGPENLRLEMSLNNPVLSNKKCTNAEIQLKFVHWNIGFMLFHKGCNGNYSRVQLGSKVLNGIDNDLSMFEVDLNQWQKILLEIKKDSLMITINGKIIFNQKTEGSLGTLQGISINTQESARLDYLKLSSAEKVLLSEDF